LTSISSSALSNTRWDQVFKFCPVDVRQLVCGHGFHISHQESRIEPHCSQLLARLARVLRPHAAVTADVPAPPRLHVLMQKSALEDQMRTVVVDLLFSARFTAPRIGHVMVVMKSN